MTSVEAVAGRDSSSGLNIKGQDTSAMNEFKSQFNINLDDLSTPSTSLDDGIFEIEGFEKNVVSVINRIVEQRVAGQNLPSEVSDLKALQTKVTITSAVVTELARRLDKYKRGMMQREEQVQKANKGRFDVLEINILLVSENERLLSDNIKLEVEIRKLKENEVKSVESAIPEKQPKPKAVKSFPNPYDRPYRNKHLRPLGSAGAAPPAKRSFPGRTLKQFSRKEILSTAKLVSSFREKRGPEHFIGTSKSSTTNRLNYARKTNKRCMLSRFRRIAQPLHNADVSTAYTQFISLLQTQNKAMLHEDFNLGDQLVEMSGMVKELLDLLSIEKINSVKWKGRWDKARIQMQEIRGFSKIDLVDGVDLVDGAGPSKENGHQTHVSERNLKRGDGTDVEASEPRYLHVTQQKQKEARSKFVIDQVVPMLKKVQAIDQRGNQSKIRVVLEQVPEKRPATSGPTSVAPRSVMLSNTVTTDLDENDKKLLKCAFERRMNNAGTAKGPFDVKLSIPRVYTVTPFGNGESSEKIFRKQRHA